ncbi:extracellular solute-binding protein [Priestia megaterium]|uniref:extracellular solute-binding protein n=1 Tax=Priestia megaterium TaxID=1404 RepID=UPI00211CE031|nr:extracellular solute-binding protein [Priestia megaterium]
MRTNKWLSVISLITTITLTGCNNQSILDSHNPIQSHKKEKQEIVIWHTYSDEETKVFENKIIPLFEKKYPTIDVKPVRQSYNEQLKFALIARASAQKAPDIVRMDITWVPFFAQLNLLYSVNKFDDFEQVKQSLLKRPLESNYYGGKYYGIPLNTNTKVAIYNKELLREVGYTKPPNTFNEIVDIAVKHHYLIGMSGYTSWESLPFFYALGGQLMNPDYTRATGYLNSQQSIQAFEKMLKLNGSSNFTTKQMANYKDTWQGVKDGNYFMVDEGPWFYSTQSPKSLKETLNKTVAAPFPVTNGKGSVLGGENLVIMKGTKHPKASWLFVKWMASPQPQEIMFKTGLIPTNKNVKLTDFNKETLYYYQNYIDGIEDAILRPKLTKWDKVDDIYTAYSSLIFSKQIGIKDGLTRAAKEIDQLLTEEKGR